MASQQRWLMKAEPDSRVVKGKDVKFSVDDFESMKATPWEGVRSHEAKNLIKEMKIKDQILFYHSNCKSPGIAGFAEVSKEAYPDYTAWDPDHPYFDPKTDKANPKWFMVDLSFTSRAAHFVPLSLLRRIAALPADTDAPTEIEYIGREGVDAIKGMALVTRGRLSVQRVTEASWGVISMLAEKGGWNEGTVKRTGSEIEGKKGKRGKKRRRRSTTEEDENANGEGAQADQSRVKLEQPRDEDGKDVGEAPPSKRKAKVATEGQEKRSSRRSSRAKKSD